MIFRKSRTDHDADIKFLNGCYWGSAAIAVASLVGSSMSSSASTSAADTQAAAANNASQVQWNMFEQQQKNQQPWLQAGEQNLASLQGQMPELTRQFTLADLQNDPGYQYRLQQGTAAVEASSAPKWGSMSGAGLKAINDYGQAMAGQQYGTAMDAFNSHQTNTFNKYATLAGVGQTAANNIGAAGQNAANNVSSNIIGAGNASAAGQVGAANAWNSGISSAIGAYQNNNLMNLLAGQNSGGGGSGYSPGGSGMTYNLP